MANFGDLNIDFYSRYEASIRLNHRFKNPLIGDVTIFLAYVFAQQVALNRSGVDTAIAQSLRMIDFTYGVLNIGDSFNATDIEIVIPRLVRYNGKGSKGFDAVFNMVDTRPSPLPSLRLYPRGFGIFGKEVNYYALQSINALISYFATKYKGEKESLVRWTEAISLCGSEYLSGRIGMGDSQGEAVNKILHTVFSSKQVSVTKCKFCDREIPTDAQFCSYCGKLVQQEGGVPSQENGVVQDEKPELDEEYWENFWPDWMVKARMTLGKYTEQVERSLFEIEKGPLAGPSMIYILHTLSKENKELASTYFNLYLMHVEAFSKIMTAAGLEKANGNLDDDKIEMILDVLAYKLTDDIMRPLLEFHGLIDMTKVMGMRDAFKISFMDLGKQAYRFGYANCHEFGYTYSKGEKSPLVKEMGNLFPV